VSLHPSSFALTDVGRKRKKNEDSYLVHEGLGLFIVADGMGGHAGGDVASAEACDQVFSMVKQGLATLETYRATPNPANAAGVRRVVESAIQAATYMIFGLADQDPARKGMGTTLSCLVVVGSRAFVGQVGDSRVYVIRNGLTTQITEDHTLINAQLKAGYITPEQAKAASYGNIITRAVGVSDHVEVDVYDFDIQAGDRFILCSDGVHGYLENHNELIGLSANRTLEQCARALVQWALERGGKDNATALVVDIVP
jgi:protein phosphatase